MLGLFCIGISLVCGLAMAEANDLPMTPRDWVLADAADGRLDEHDLFTAAVILSGADDAVEIDGYQTHLERLAIKAQAAVGEVTEVDPPNKGLQGSAHLVKLQAVLRILHDELLTGHYDPGCGDVRRALDVGDFNCATATLLFQALIRRCDLHSDTVALPGHVRCRWGIFALETTDRTGQFSAHATGGVKPVSGAERTLDDVQLLAKLLYNQGLQHLASQRFAAALESTELSSQLDPQHIASRQNVAAVVNNWAVRLSSPGTYEQAIQLLQRGQAVAPNYGLLAANERHLWQAWWADTVAEGAVAKAREIRERANRLHPSMNWGPETGSDR